MIVRERDIPPESALSGALANVYYADSYEVPLRRNDLDIRTIYLAIFAHLPKSFKTLLKLRNRIVAPLGLKTASDNIVNRPKIKDNYEVGEKIVRFTMRSQTENEIIAGDDDKHLNFRVSVLRLNEGGGPKVVLTTIVTTHNLLGRAYLSAIKPFHKHGVKSILANAVKAGRI